MRWVSGASTREGEIELCGRTRGERVRIWDGGWWVGIRKYMNDVYEVGNCIVKTRGTLQMQKRVSE